MAKRLPTDRLHFDRAVANVDPAQHQLVMADGESIAYDTLISSMSLDDLLTSLVGWPELSAAASRFVYSSSHIIGVAWRGGRRKI